MTIPEQHLFILAEQAISDVFEQVDRSGRDGWARPIAAEGAMSGGTARDVVIAHARDDQWVGHTLSGGTIEDGKALFPEEPLGANLLAGWLEISERARAAALALDEPDRPVHLSFGSFGDFSARDYLQQIITYRALQAWDLARALELADPLTDELVTGLAELLAPVAEQWRAWGVFGPEVAVPADATPRHRLLGLTGRRP
ncbi:MAG TPA: hypothetical protein VH141_29185 [Pseudonocardia sp.]|jgi:uncharacterized protein (TIGR03086 family)|nr:hypothetical protein [Pseudonocardia sp.]